MAKIRIPDELCSNDLASTERPKYSPGLYVHEAVADFQISQWFHGNPIPQKLTLVEGWPYLKCLHGWKLALPGGLPYQVDRVTLALSLM